MLRKRARKKVRGENVTPGLAFVEAGKPRPVLAQQDNQRTNERRTSGQDRVYGATGHKPGSRFGQAALVIALVGFAASPARAVVLSEDEFTEDSTELGAVARTFLFLFLGETLQPPFTSEDASPSSSSIFDVRLYFVKRMGSLKLVLHNQLTALSRSHQMAGDLGRGQPPPRWLPLSVTAVDGPTLRLASNVDWLYAAWTQGSLTLTVGRQPVSFGRGKLWSPMDLVGTFALTEVDTEYKPGADAVRADYGVDRKTTLTAVVAPGELEATDRDLETTWRGSTVIARGKRVMDGGEWGLLAGFVRGDGVLGFDAVYDTGSFELHGEVTGTYVTGKSLASPDVMSGDVIAKAIFGATMRPTAKLILGPELLLNGFGASDAQGYAEQLSSQRVAIGEQATLGRAYVGATANWEAHPLVHLVGASLVNVQDPSCLLSLALDYSVSDDVSAALGAYVPLGKSPELQLLSLRTPSEYGLYPNFFFFQLKAAI